MSQWFRQIEGDESGPFTDEELQFLIDRGKLTRSCLIRRSTETQWKTAKTFPNLFNTTRKPGPAGSQAKVSDQNTNNATGAAVERADIPPIAEQDLLVPENTQTTSSPPLPPEREDREAKERRRRIITGILIGGGVVLLILLLLLLFLTVGQPGVGDVASGGNGGSQGAGGAGAGQGRLNADAGPESSEAGNSNTRASDEVATNSQQNATDANAVASDNENTSPEVSPEFRETGNLFELSALNEPATEAPVATSGNVGGGVLGGEGGGGAGVLGAGGIGGAQEFLGVKVRGKLALVCDTSGSMSSDLQVLFKELMENFPKDTPVILVVGCVFNPAIPNAPPPQNISPYGQLPGNPNVYQATSTTDAILFAVTTLKRDTVMFNNDLQDGGSEQAIQAFRDLRKKRRFTLSGRSLNCEAPECLLKFIKSSGGDFKVDPISRSPQPPRTWGP